MESDTDADIKYLDSSSDVSIDYCGAESAAIDYVGADTSADVDYAGDELTPIDYVGINNDVDAGLVGCIISLRLNIVYVLYLSLLGNRFVIIINVSV